MPDITLLTERRYYQPKEVTPYVANILLEARLLGQALEDLGFTVSRTYWDNQDYDFSKTRAVVIRTVWDYFERFSEFMPWIRQLDKQTRLVNPLELIEWNIDKRYLLDLEQKGFPIVPTVVIDKGSDASLAGVSQASGWDSVVIKPTISGAAYQTYKVPTDTREAHEGIFKGLTSQKDMIIQPFIETITELGEASLMVFGGRYTHAILKKAKPGDFRVQDDFGGTVHPYQPTAEEIDLAQAVFSSLEPVPAYGRVDVVWDSSGNALISEVEIIEPELWLRNHPDAAAVFARAIAKYL